MRLPASTSPIEPQRNNVMPSRFAFLNRHTRLEDWALQKLTGLETFCHTRMRRESFPRCWFSVSLLPVSALAASTSLMLSQVSSLEEASEVCQERFATIMPKLSSFQEKYYENASHFNLMPGIRRSTVTLFFLSIVFLSNSHPPKQPR